MNKKNNKGFTLLELLISIFILTTVIFLGYKVINKSTMYIKNQSNIHKGQLTVNDMNEYLTKDLERASSVVLSSNYLTQTNTFTDDSTQENKISNENLKDAFINYSGDKPFDYSYNINYKENNFGVIYEVNITKKDDNNYIYNIKRTDEKDGLSITFIQDEIIKKDLLQLPFEISLNNPYKVNLGYSGKNNEFEKHEFTVVSRLSYFNNGENEDTGSSDSKPPTEITPPSTEEIPEIPSDVSKEYFQSIGYWMMDTEYYNPTSHDGDLYTWIQDKEGISDNYGKQGTNTEEFYILATNSSKDNPSNSGDTHAYMKDYKESGIYLTNVLRKSLKPKYVNKIKIYVSPYTTVKQTKVEVNSKNKKFIGIKDEEGTYLSPEKDSYTLEGGEKGKWYDIEIKKIANGDEQINFKIDGMLSIDKEKVKEKEKSGYAMIVYGDSSSEELNGDLIFEITKNKSQNDGQYNWDCNKKFNMLGITSENGKGKLESSSKFENQEFTIFLANDSQAKIRARLYNENEISDQRIAKIVGMKIKLQGKIEVTISQFPHVTNFKSIKLTDTKKIYEFTELKKLQGDIKGTINISSEENIGDTSRIIIDFIYEE